MEADEIFRKLEDEKEKLQHLLDRYDESTLGHIKFYDGPYGFINVLQGVQLIVYHEKNDFQHIKSILEKLT